MSKLTTVKMQSLKQYLKDNEYEVFEVDGIKKPISGKTLYDYMYLQEDLNKHNNKCIETAKTILNEPVLEKANGESFELLHVQAYFATSINIRKISE